jgi:ribosomal protein S18 acetylase RimI-like enzyme
MSDNSAPPSAPSDANAITIRRATAEDHETIWRILEPTIRAGETYTLARDLNRDDALAFWFARGHETFVALIEERVLGTYFLRTNHGGGGSHIANCGYMTRSDREGRGIGRAMLEHSLARAKSRGFRGMQFNFVVSSNQRAVKIWQAYGFEIVGRLPLAFEHPRLGFVDALVMFKRL